MGIIMVIINTVIELTQDTDLETIQVYEERLTLAKQEPVQEFQLLIRGNTVTEQV